MSIKEVIKAVEASKAHAEQLVKVTHCYTIPKVKCIKAAGDVGCAAAQNFSC